MLRLMNSRCTKQLTGPGRRNLWRYLNIAFNSVDDDRRKNLGPDRTCAEWLLRNGAQVMWLNSSEYLADYNILPSEKENIKKYIKAINASDSSISHYGFPHLVGCNHIEKVILHKCEYIEDKALPLLEPLNKSLRYLEVSGCGNVTDAGLNSLASLTNLNSLVISDLPYIKDKESILKNLRERLPKCNIIFK